MSWTKHFDAVVHELLGYHPEQDVPEQVWDAMANGKPLPMLKRRLEAIGWPSTVGTHEKEDFEWVITEHWVPTMVNIAFNGRTEESLEASRKARNPHNLEDGQYWLELCTATGKQGTRLYSRQQLLDKLLSLAAKLIQDSYCPQHAGAVVLVEPDAEYPGCAPEGDRVCVHGTPLAAGEQTTAASCVHCTDNDPAPGDPGWCDVCGGPVCRCPDGPRYLDVEA